MEQQNKQLSILKKAVTKAIEQLYEKDSYLLAHDVNERALSHKLACYLQQAIEEWDNSWHVDCEYNRDYDNPKVLMQLSLASAKVMPTDTQATTVYPDIIVHKRGSRENLLAIEIKKASNRRGRNHDYEKLGAFKRELGYQHTLFLELSADRKPFMDWDHESGQYD
jgi:hypothetical protein